MAEHSVDIEVKCKSGHVPSASDYHALRCGFGKWKWLNGDKLACTPKPCKVKEDDIDGKNYKNSNIGKTVSHGEEVDIKCKDNYEIVDDNAEVIRCKYGRFKPSAFPKCNPKMCATFEVENGFEVTEAVHGTKSEIQCDDGYILEGSYSVHCQFGSWMPYIPACVKGKYFI